ncbi:hypothetical protein A3F02_02700 [Candidatus Curtissbacteria bacterium RIFCSPHIGHO2_12_FULL_38_9b]|uniref:Uncharacterized protein n=1 Tax=Candidatus Curtissbacteria bacterium RIFCSPHIGHO2_12_FULL_38_9b TaxID=1797720 RepID=A0A1F5GUL7_9BACT|nr:MAG: hypothetical protein A3F02_02700 [Candidatus Curtissbacteria bacterium RIFCSPHIGHO2_12_FULL_38_9b]
MRAIISHSSSKNRSKYIALIIATIVLFFVSLRIEAPIFNNTYSQNEAGLRKTAEKQYELNNQGEAGLREIYKNYLSSSFKNSTTEDKYVSGIVTNDQSEGIQGNKFDIHAIYLNGAEGYVDRTIYFCADTSCANVKFKSRTFREYVYENQKWLMTEKPVLCPRTTKYPMPEEFSRSLSLIIQRFGDPKSDTSEISNCVNIQYANNDAQLNNAEGLFSFSPGQSTSKLDIYVSPRYRYTDDLVTAYLVTHELAHAHNYVIGQASGKVESCFADEASAFDFQVRFLGKLNVEENKSLDARIRQGGSQELMNIYNTLLAISRNRGSNLYEKALNYVMSDPSYQKQCSGR